MDSFLPANFPEALGGLLLIVAIISAIFSLWPCLRGHALRLLAIFIVASLALFANSPAAYFVAIFVIATAVTELEFLQNLAAIVRGNKDYFDYQKDVMSVKEKFANLASEVKQLRVLAETEEDSESPLINVLDVDVKCGDEIFSDIKQEEKIESSSEELVASTDNSANLATVSDCDEHEPVVKRSLEHNRSRIIDIRRVYELESKALDKLESVYGGAIERGVMLQNAVTKVELDGLISGHSDPGVDTVFEVKYLRNSRNFISWIGLVSSSLKRIAVNYRRVTGKVPKIHFVIILDQAEQLTLRQKRELRKLPVDSVSLFSSGELK